jgi:uncharacterized membrane protein required for colicin V production
MMKIGTFAYSWFDLAVVAVLAVGILRGRSRGMSEELLDVLKWLSIVVLGGLAYQPLGTLLSDYTHLGLAAAYVTVYIGLAIALRLFFGWLKHLVGEKLVGGDVFGNWEYYLGMAAGAVRFGCYLVVGMALLNAYHVSPEQLAADARMQQENFGDISFPTLGRIQQSVFNGSASGQLVKTYLGHELIVNAPSERSAAPAETFRAKRERAIYEVLGEKK